jgi:hypothetical protein
MIQLGEKHCKTLIMESGILRKHVGLIKMCMLVVSSSIYIDKQLSD